MKYKSGDKTCGHNPQHKAAVAHGRGQGPSGGPSIGAKKAAILAGKKGSETPTQKRARMVAAARPQMVSADKIPA